MHSLQDYRANLNSIKGFDVSILLYILLHSIYAITLYLSYCAYRFDQEGTRVSVVHYFKQRYNYYLQYTHWPCLQAGRVDKQIYLPIEVALLCFFICQFDNSNLFWTTICMNKYINLLDISIYSHVIISFILMQVCSIVQGQRYSSKLNENQVRNILQFTCERPADRQTRTFEVDSH